MHNGIEDQDEPIAANRTIRHSWTLFSIRIVLLSAALVLAAYSVLRPDTGAVLPSVSELPAPSAGELVHVETGGKVVSVHVRLGQNVKAGDILIRTEGGEIRAPHDGQVLALAVSAPGEIVEAGTPVASILPRAVLAIEA